MLSVLLVVLEGVLCSCNTISIDLIVEVDLS